LEVVEMVEWLIKKFEILYNFFNIIKFAKTDGGCKHHRGLVKEG
jgi:hypothetical protein